MSAEIKSAAAPSPSFAEVAGASPISEVALPNVFPVS